MLTYPAPAYLGIDVRTGEEVFHCPGRFIVSCSNEGDLEVILDEKILAEAQNRLIQNGPTLRYYLSDEQAGLIHIDRHIINKFDKCIQRGNLSSAEGWAIGCYWDATLEGESPEYFKLNPYIIEEGEFEEYDYEVEFGEDEFEDESWGGDEEDYFY